MERKGAKVLTDFRQRSSAVVAINVLEEDFKIALCNKVTIIAPNIA